MTYTSVTPAGTPKQLNTVFGTDAALNGKGVETVEVAATAAYRAGNVTPRVSYAHGFKAKVDGQKTERYSIRPSYRWC